MRTRIIGVTKDVLRRLLREGTGAAESVGVPPDLDVVSVRMGTDNVLALVSSASFDEVTGDPWETSPSWEPQYQTPQRRPVNMNPGVEGAVL